MKISAYKHHLWKWGVGLTGMLCVSSVFAVEPARFERESLLTSKQSSLVVVKKEHYEKVLLTADSLFDRIGITDRVEL